MISRKILRACTSTTTTVDANMKGGDYNHTKSVVDANCVKTLMSISKK